MANTILLISVILWVGETIIVGIYCKPHEGLMLPKIVSPIQFILLLQPPEVTAYALTGWMVMIGGSSKSL
jgi:hypothetical protein